MAAGKQCSEVFPLLLNAVVSNPDPPEDSKQAVALLYTESFQWGGDTRFASFCITISHVPLGLPYYGKSWQLLQVKGEIHAEVGSEEGCDGDCEAKVKQTGGITTVEK